MPEGQHPPFYSVLSHAPVRAAGNGVDLSIYHQASMGRSWGDLGGDLLASWGV